MNIDFNKIKKAGKTAIQNSQQLNAQTESPVEDTINSQTPPVEVPPVTIHIPEQEVDEATKTEDMPQDTDNTPTVTPPTFGQEPIKESKLKNVKEGVKQFTNLMLGRTEELLAEERQEREQKKINMLKKVQEAKDSNDLERARELILQYVEENRNKGLTSYVSKGIKWWDELGKDKKGENGEVIKGNIGARLTKTALSIAGTGAMTYLGVKSIDQLGIKSSSEVIKAGVSTYLGKKIILGVGISNISAILIHKLQKFQNLDNRKQLLILSLLGIAVASATVGLVFSGAVGSATLGTSLLYRGAAGAVGFAASRLTRKYEGKIKNRTEEVRKSINLDDLEANLSKIEKEVEGVLKKSDWTRILGKGAEIFVAGAVGTLALEAAGMTHQGTGSGTQHLPLKTGIVKGHEIIPNNPTGNKTEVELKNQHEETTQHEPEAGKINTEDKKVTAETTNKTPKPTPFPSNSKPKINTNEIKTSYANKIAVKTEEEDFEAKLDPETRRIVRDLKEVERLSKNEGSTGLVANTDQEWRVKLNPEQKNLLERIEKILDHKLKSNPFEKNEMPKPDEVELPYPKKLDSALAYKVYDPVEGRNISYDTSGNEINTKEFDNLGNDVNKFYPTPNQATAFHEEFDNLGKPKVVKIGEMYNLGLKKDLPILTSQENPELKTSSQWLNDKTHIPSQRTTIVENKEYQKNLLNKELEKAPIEPYKGLSSLLKAEKNIQHKEFTYPPIQEHVIPKVPILENPQDTIDTIHFTEVPHLVEDLPVPKGPGYVDHALNLPRPSGDKLSSQQLAYENAKLNVLKSYGDNTIKPTTLLSREDQSTLNTNKVFTENNPFNLAPEKIVEIIKVNGRIINNVFPENHLPVWLEFRNKPMSSLEYIATNNRNTDMERLAMYTKELQKLSGIIPKTKDGLVLQSENIETYISRALSKISADGNLDKIKNFQVNFKK